jgi:hypothetical protein
MRKQRTRQHIIEDLGFNHLERQILYAGYTFYRYSHNDYGYDGSITTFNEQGEVENTQINVQLKSTDNLTHTTDKQFFVLDVSKRDLELWCSSDVPVILALYDAQQEIAYYVDIVEYFRKDGISLEKVRKFVRIKIPPTNVFTAEVMTKLRHIKNQIN